jgi:1,5-anhydro-D-fructose reductase (1,5-anhydro-D-mannitol-forming)
VAVRRRVGWALVGTGAIARSRMAPAIARHDGSRVVAVVSSSAERAAALAAATDAARALAAATDAARAYTSLDAALADDAVDAVYIATTNELHAAQAIASLRAGRHVLCEKPLALSLHDAEAMVAAASEAGRTLAVNHHLRAAASLRRLRGLAGAIGQPRLIRSLHRCHVRPERRGNWRMRDAARGAGAILDLTVHTADVIRFLTGLEVTSVCGDADGAGFGEGGIEGAVAGTMRLDGVLASFADAYSPLPALSSIEVHGDDGCLAARDVGAGEDTYGRTVERFVAAVRGDGRPYATGEDGRCSLAVAVALRAAVVERRTVLVGR